MGHVQSFLREFMRSWGGLNRWQRPLLRLSPRVRSTRYDFAVASERLETRWLLFNAPIIVGYGLGHGGGLSTFSGNVIEEELYFDDTGDIDPGSFDIISLPPLQRIDNYEYTTGNREHSGTFAFRPAEESTYISGSGGASFSINNDTVSLHGQSAMSYGDDEDPYNRGVASGRSGGGVTTYIYLPVPVGTEINIQYEGHIQGDSPVVYIYPRVVASHSAPGDSFLLEMSQSHTGSPNESATAMNTRVTQSPSFMYEGQVYSRILAAQASSGGARAFAHNAIPRPFEFFAENQSDLSLHFTLAGQDIAAKSITSVDGGILYSWESTAGITPNTAVKLYWAGPTPEDLLTVIDSTVIGASGPGSKMVSREQLLQVPRPSAAEYVVLVADPSNSIAEADETNNISVMRLVGDVSLTYVYFGGEADLPTSKVSFAWQYINNDPFFAGPDEFTASLYYSADRIFDDGDRLSGKPIKLTADSREDAGVESIELGRRKWLRPDPERPYVLLVLNNGEQDPTPENNYRDRLLPYLDIVSVDTEGRSRKNAWLNTLLKATVFHIKFSPQLIGSLGVETDLVIEYRRLGPAMAGELVEWVPMVAGTEDMLEGVHRLAGTFEYRVAVTIYGQKFTSSSYHGSSSKKKPLPQIDVRFPLADDLANHEGLQSLAATKWRENDDWIVANGSDEELESATYVVVDTATGRYGVLANRTNEVLWISDQGTMGGSVADGGASVGLFDPPPDLYNAGTHTAQYIVAHLHTHSRLETNPSGVSHQTAGPSEDDSRQLIELFKKRYKTEIVGLVYDFEGETGPGSPLPGTNGYFPGYDYASDAGQLFQYGYTRRRSVGR